jgi:hypothetical protein
MLEAANPHGSRLQNSLFTLHPEAPPDDNGSERELRPTTTHPAVRNANGSRSGLQRAMT